MTIQKYLSNNMITGIVHHILVQRGQIIASDVYMIWYRCRCAYTRSGVCLYQIKAFHPPNIFFMQNTLHYYYFILQKSVCTLWKYLNDGKIPKINDFMVFSKFQNWCTILIQFSTFLFPLKFKIFFIINQFFVFPNKNENIQVELLFF